LAAMVAHDVSTPLNSISGHAQLLMQRGDLDGEAVGRLKLIEAQIARVVEILHTLLTTSSAAEPVFKPVDVNQLVKGLLDLMSPVLSRKGVEAVTTLDANLPPVSGDTAQLQEVLLNCIVNALDAMPNGGSLRLTTQRAPSGRRIAVGDQPSWLVDLDDRSPGRDKDHVAIAVTDTGVGIPPEHLDHIFEPFFTTKEIGKGTGLGLSICRRIVKAHGGRIEVESQVGVGTTFGIILPALKG